MVIPLKIMNRTVKTEKQAESRFSRIPLLFRYFIFILCGWIVLAIPGLISFFFYSKRVTELNTAFKFSALNFTSQGDVVFEHYAAKGFSIEGYPAFFYTAFLAISWFYLWVILYATRVLPIILVRLTNLLASTFNTLEAGVAVTHCKYHDSNLIDISYLTSLRIYLSITFYCLANVIAWALMFPDTSSKPSNLIISQIFSLLLIGSIVWSIEKLFLQIFTKEFNNRAVRAFFDPF
jgi:hypothetical protein